MPCVINLTSDMEVRSFFYARKDDGYIVRHEENDHALACTECKQRNYNMTKEKKNHPERMETQKYCKFCRKHTLHKETK